MGLSKMVTLLVSMGWFGALMTPATSHGESSCRHLMGTCDYYRCIEDQEISCGDQGYLLGFGGYYCDKFSAKDFEEWKTPRRQRLFPSDANQWRDQVRLCLQEQMEEFLEAEPQASCKQVQDFAFGSHPTCYTYAPSFCHMTPESILSVGLTLEPKELKNPAVRLQMKQTAQICVRQLEDRLQVEEGPWLRFELKQVRNLWKAVAKDPLMILGQLPRPAS